MNTYRAQEIANYIVNRSIERGHPINNLTLMNLLYYLQRKSLRQKSQRLFLGRVRSMADWASCTKHLLHLLYLRRNTNLLKAKRTARFRLGCQDDD